VLSVLLIWSVRVTVRRPALSETVRRQHLTVVLISIDTLRADHLGAYGYSGHTSPFIDGIGARGAVFESIITPLPATDPSHAAMLTGQHPLVTGVLSNAMTLAPGVETIAEVFRNAGYATAGATGVYHLSDRYGFAQGFDQFTSVTMDAAVRRSADAVNADVLRLIRTYKASTPDRPLFLFVHYFDVHAPYIGLPDAAKYGPGLRSPASIEELTRAYDAGIRSVDTHVAQVWQALQNAGLAENSIIAITADHGEQLGEHGMTGGHADLYSETIRVPLILAGPGIIPTRVRACASLLDLAPTLLGLTGLRFSGPTTGRPIGHPSAASWIPSLRPLLVLGYPTYARSIGLLVNRTYYVRNFEKVYEALTVGPESATKPDVPARRADLQRTGSSQTFFIPALDFEPQQVTLVVDVGLDCKTDLTISIPPGIELSPHLTITTPTQVTYSVARLDSSFVTTTPTGCVKDITWSHQKLQTSGLLATTGMRVPSTLFNTISTPRRNSTADEFFDLGTDPEMTRNIIGVEPFADVATLKRTLEEAFVRELHPGAKAFTFSREELERLRSLGYLQ
jgi:hypothetical protein